MIGIVSDLMLDIKLSDDAAVDVAADDTSDTMTRLFGAVVRVDVAAGAVLV